MFQIRFHGRGGQGVVTAAEMLSIAAFNEGKHAQAFPSFGSERMGAPVISYCRIDDKEIRLREPIAAPDAIIIQDPTLLRAGNIFEGLKPEGFLVLNSSRSFAELGIASLTEKMNPRHLALVAATELAMKYVGRPMPNAVLLGGFVAVTGVIKLESVEGAIREKFPGSVGDANIAAARAAYEIIVGRS
ncbi:MAG: 2-oxoacid:acceptor oxidoreductase family protein [Magnetococcales bacterium]|nr:2-oxoacid:acceptor oxidoreductase family protein [Magnetococcales bacterium]